MVEKPSLNPTHSLHLALKITLSPSSYNRFYLISVKNRFYLISVIRKHDKISAVIWTVPAVLSLLPFLRGSMYIFSEIDCMCTYKIDHVIAIKESGKPA